MVEQIADGVFLVQGTDVNWVIVRDGDDLTLVDTGWPGDRRALEQSLAALGRTTGDVHAVLLTHAHIDHIGGAQWLADTRGVPVLTGPVEVAHAHRERLEQASARDVLVRAWRPRAAAWSLRITRAGAMQRLSVPAAQPLDGSGPLDLPGGPVPVASPGHTSGHTAYHLPAAGVLVSGDALITGHPLSDVAGPQLVPEFFAHDRPGEIASLEALGAVDADVLAPGHGPVWRGRVSDAAARAADAARRPR